VTLAAAVVALLWTMRHEELVSVTS